MLTSFRGKGNSVGVYYKYLASSYKMLNSSELEGQILKIQTGTSPLYITEYGSKDKVILSIIFNHVK